MASQNGWPVDESGGLQDRTAVYGVTFPNGVRRGDVATVLLWVAGEFHRTVEPLTPGACWGWYVKQIEGGTSVSNHASGTAIDLNAPTHPIGKAGTFSPGKVAAIRRILTYCDGVVRWGGNYSGRKDEMHWEIVGNTAQVAALAAKIREGDTVSKQDVIDALKSAAGQAALTAWLTTNAGKRAVYNAVLGVETSRDPATGAVNFPGLVNPSDAPYNPADPATVKPGVGTMSLASAINRLVARADQEHGEVPPTADQNAQAVVAAIRAGSPEATAAALKAVLGDQAAEVGRLLTTI